MSRLGVTKTMNLREFIGDTIREEFLSAAWKRMNQPLFQSEDSEILQKFIDLQNAEDRANSTQVNFLNRTASNSREVSINRFKAVKNLRKLFGQINSLAGATLKIEGVDVKFLGVSVEVNNGFANLHFRYATDNGEHKGEFVVGEDEGFEFIDPPPGIDEKANRRLSRKFLVEEEQEEEQEEKIEANIPLKDLVVNYNSLFDAMIDCRYNKACSKTKGPIQVFEIEDEKGKYQLFDGYHRLFEYLIDLKHKKNAGMIPAEVSNSYLVKQYWAVAPEASRWIYDPLKKYGNLEMFFGTGGKRKLDIFVKGR